MFVPASRSPSLLFAMLLMGLCSFAQGADTGSLSVSAVVVSKSNCKFSVGGLALNFGTVNPASTVDATASATMNFVCQGSAPLATFFISAGDGAHSAGPGVRRMQHATAVPTEFMAYSLSLSPTSATVSKGAIQTLTVTGTIQPGEFQNVRAGAYQDTVVITLAP